MRRVKKKKRKERKRARARPRLVAAIAALAATLAAPMPPLPPPVPPPASAPSPPDDGEQGSEIERELDGRLKAQGYWFDAAEADRFCMFCSRICRHSKGEWAGKPLTLAPWQRRKLRRLFGWRRPDGTRRYRRTAWWIPRKNGKSTVFAAIALYLTFFDGEPGAEVYSAASNKEQADMVFVEAKNMTEASEELLDRGSVLKNSIYVPSTLSVYRVLSSKAGTKHGLNVHGIVIDELHALKNRELFDVLTTASGSRRQPLEVTISTAGSNIGSFAYEIWEYSKNVAAGLFEDPEFLPVVFAADPSDDWRDEAVWAKANPNLGVSISLDYLRSERTKTKGMPGRIAAFKQLHLNIWAQSTQAWLPLDRWRRDCIGPNLPIRSYRGRACWGALDLSSTTDLTALALVFEPDENGVHDAAVFFWCPADTINDREREDHVQYAKWVEQGWIRATPGNVVDYDQVERDIARIAQFVNLRELAFDRWGAAQLTQRLQDTHGITLARFGQGFKDMSPAAKEFERLILSGRIRTIDNPVLTWQISTVTAKRDPAGNIKPDKSQARHRIDGVVALVMAVGRASLGAEPESVYENRGILTL